jgi:hypothetical protein
MVDLEGFFFALKYGEFGGIKTIFFLGQKKFFGAFASPFLFCLQSGKKNLAKIKIKIIGLVDSYESFQKYPIVPIPASMFIKK